MKKRQPVKDNLPTDIEFLFKELRQELKGSKKEKLGQALLTALLTTVLTGGVNFFYARYIEKQKINYEIKKEDVNRTLKAYDELSAALRNFSTALEDFWSDLLLKHSEGTTDSIFDGEDSESFFKKLLKARDELEKTNKSPDIDGDVSNGINNLINNIADILAAIAQNPPSISSQLTRIKEVLKDIRKAEQLIKEKKPKSI